MIPIRRSVAAPARGSRVRRAARKRSVTVAPGADPGRPGQAALGPADRNANLDGLRALAISLVVVVNAAGEHLVDVGPLGDRILHAGWLGVDLFFVLSGWLVGSLYWREHRRYGSVELGRFWARRWLRTVPPYLVVFACVVVAYGAMGHETAGWGHFLAFTQNYLEPMPFWGVSWSLAVEEHFYLALPLLMGVALRYRGGVPTVLAALAVGSLLARLWTVPDGASQWGLHYTATHMRLEGLAFGVAASYVAVMRPEAWPALQRAARWLLLPGLLVVGCVPWLPTDVLNRVAYTLADVAFCALLVVVVRRPALPFATSRAVRVLAETSYSLYMTHLLVFNLVVRTPAASLPGPALLAVSLAAAVVVAGAFYVAVEVPALRWRQRWAPRRSESEARPAVTGVRVVYG